MCVVFAMILLITSIRWNGPYRGKVVELETGKPIEGAVVAATWSFTCLNMDRICAAKETLTGQDGSFKLPLAWCLIAPFATSTALQPSEVVVFKPGYLGYPPFLGTREERRGRMPDFTGEEFRNSNQFYVIKLGRPTTTKELIDALTTAESPLIHNMALRRLPILLKMTNEVSKSYGLGARPAK